MDSNLNLLQREKKIDWFNSGEFNFLITTDVLSRGVDFKGLKMVLSYDIPLDMVNFIHRVGWTGRAGKKGKAITFFTKTDIPIIWKLADLLKESGCKVPEWIF